MKRRRWPWLMVAAVLIGLAAWLMSAKDPEREERRKLVKLPRAMTAPERARAEGRRTHVPAPAAAPAAPDVPPQPQRPRDPMIAALPSRVEVAAVVVEANALRHSPVGQLLIECLNSRDDGRGLARFKAQTGIDPLEDLDRLAMMDDTVVMSGHFANARWDSVFPEGGTPFGEKGTLYQAPPRRDGEAPSTVGLWDGQMVIIGDSDEEVRAVMDRLEGRGTHGAPVFDESQTYGEIYGVLSAAALAKALPQEQAELAGQIERMAERIELHVDATKDVGIVARVTGPNGEDARDLGKTLGTALAVARAKAQMDGKTELADLMDLARVVPGEGDFRMEMGLPLEVMEKHLKECVERNKARNEARSRRAADEPPR